MIGDRQQQLKELPPDDPEAGCIKCRRKTDLIQHDGPVVCTPCVRTFTELADDPHDVDDRILTAITERHGDVVQLIKHSPTGRPSRLVWDWIGWP